MHPVFDHQLGINRRHFFGRAGIGAAALAATMREAQGESSGLHFPARAKRVIYLFQSGAPSQMDLFDYKPGLAARFGTDLPDSIRQGQRLTGMTAGQDRFPVAPSRFKFAQPQPMPPLFFPVISHLRP